ncbi:MAG: protein kinase [Gemmataceae bacterium]
MASAIENVALLDKIGQGGMGVVLRARDSDFSRVLAVKVLPLAFVHDADLKRRFLEEAQVMAQLQHPGIPPVHHRGELPDGRPYYSMKLIQGKTLAELLPREARDTHAAAATIVGDGERPAKGLPGRFWAPPSSTFSRHFEQVCQTMAYAPDRRILHRDLETIEHHGRRLR